MQALSAPRPLDELDGDASGQMVTEWVLVTIVVVIPIILLIPTMLWTVSVYFYRIAEVVSLPFP
jgi:hypothetical protein